MDDWVAVRARAKATVSVGAQKEKAAVRVQQIRTQQAEAGLEFQQSRWRSIQQLEDILDAEIALIRRLMVRVSEKKTAERKQRNNNNKKKTVTDCEGIASGRMQHKVWKPGGMQKKNIATDDQLQNKVWDPGRQD